MGAPPTKFPSGFDTSRVWSPAGGWFADPKAWKRNTAIGFLAAGAAAVAIFSHSRKVEVRARRRPRSSPLSARVAARRATATFSSNRSRRRARSIDRRGGFRTSERLAALFRPPIPSVHPRANGVVSPLTDATTPLSSVSSSLAATPAVADATDPEPGVVRQLPGGRAEEVSARASIVADARGSSSRALLIARRQSPSAAGGA